MSTAGNCSRCGAALPASAPGQRCPKCLLQFALNPVAAEADLPLDTPSGSGGASPGTIHYFGDYELLEEIARGGMGVVWKARQVSLNRIVAVKLLLAGKFSSPEFVKRFHTEAEAAANLRHPNIVAIHEVGQHEDQHYFSMEYVEGQDLARMVGNQPLPARRAVAYLKTISEAVHHAHHRGVLHRDLKPSNILIDTNDQPRVTDFGLAKRLPSKSEIQPPRSEEVDLTVTGQVLGTPSYMPPEQATGRRGEISVASDVYSLGAILFYILTGRPPFQAETFEATLRQVTDTEPTSPRLLIPSLSRDLETICFKCLAKEPSRRYESAKDLADDLERWLNGQPIHARPVSVPEKLWRWCQRKPALAGMILGLHLVAAAGLFGILWQWARARQSADEARLAQRETITNLWHSYLAQARANRSSGRLGRRFDALDVLAKAAAIRPAPELRDEAIAALALTDARLTNTWTFRQDGKDIGHIYSPNLDFYVVNGTSGEGRMHRTADNAEIGLLPSVGHSISAIGCFSPDGRWLASMGSLGKLHVWEVPARRLVLTNLPDAAWAFTPDSRQFLVAGRDCRVSLYDLESRTLARQYPTETVVCANAAIDPQGRRFAGGGEGQQAVTIFDLTTGAAILSFTNSAAVNCLAWSPDGQSLAVGGVNGMLVVWDAQTGEERRRLEGHEGTLVALGYNRAGTMLVSTSWDDTWRMWDAQSWRPLLTLPSISYHVQFSGDDLTAGYINHEGKVTLLEVASSACFRRIQPPRKPSGNGHSLDISRDGRLALAALRDGFALWDLVAGKELIFAPANQCSSAIFTPDGASIITSDADGVRRWPLTRTLLKEREEFRLGSGQIIQEGARRFAAVSADGRWACAIHEFTNRVTVFSLNDPTQTLVVGQHSAASAVAFSSDGHWLATGTWKGDGVKVWNVHEGRLEHEMAELGTATVEFSRDGRWLATGSRRFQVWDTASWREIYRIEKPDPDSAWSWMTFSPDSRMLAVILDNRDLRLLEAATGRVLANLEAPDRPRLAHLRFTPDNKKLVALQNDHGIQVWDLRRLRAELATIKLDWDTPAYPSESDNAR